jgi:hypothetical protein
MAVIDQGGGGGRAGGAGVDNYALDQPYDITGEPTIDKMQQIDEMLRLLFQAATKNKTRLDAIVPTASTWTTVFKLVDESANNNRGAGANIVVIDNNLQFPMAGGKTYVIRFKIFFELDGVGVGNTLRHQWLGPATPTLVHGVVGELRAAYAGRQLLAFDTVNQDLRAFTGNNDAQGIASGDFLVKTAGGGTFSFNWVSGSSTAASAIVRAGSHIEYTTIG